MPVAPTGLVAHAVVDGVEFGGVPPKTPQPATATTKFPGVKNGAWAGGGVCANAGTDISSVTARANTLIRPSPIGRFSLVIVVPVRFTGISRSYQANITGVWRRIFLGPFFVFACLAD